MTTFLTKLLKSYLSNTVLQSCYTCSQQTSSFLSINIKHCNKTNKHTNKNKERKENREYVKDCLKQKQNQKHSIKLHDLYYGLDTVKKTDVTMYVASGHYKKKNVK